MEKDQSESAKINFDVSFDVDVTLVCDDQLIWGFLMFSCKNI